MNEEVKAIMRLSFHDHFFVDRNSRDANFEYLDSLVDCVLAKEKSDDYEEIANRIWILDKRIQKMFTPNMEIMPLCFRDYFVDEFWKDCCGDTLSVEDIKRIGRCSKNVDDFKMKFNISMIIHNWEVLGTKQKNKITDRLLQFLQNVYAINLNKGTIYKPIKIDDDMYLTIAVNELINWLSTKINIKFSHQTINAIRLLQYYEKVEMYFQINEELSNRNNGGENSGAQSILTSVIRPLIPAYEEDDNGFVFTDKTDEKINISNAYIFMYDELCKYVRKSVQGELCYDRELKRKNIEIQEKQEEIDTLQKKVSKLQYEIDKLQKTCEIERQSAQKEQKAIEKELFSLREYAFNRIDESNHLMEGKEDVDVYCGDYSNVVVVGGHNTWQRKVIDRLPGINILSTDQNVIDWNFMNRMEVVVIVINHISHSMYYRVIDKVREQELIYLDYKNIDQLQNELDALLIKNDARKSE